jgi:16S rRNA (cytidine1402-2'-O)-methyltransferase
MPIRLLNEHSNSQSWCELLEPLKKGEIWGLVSDAGLACIADPGAELVSLARKAGIQVRAVLGPCSIIHALMLSGFSGQQFIFHGYLPKDREIRQKKLKNMEKSAISEGFTQIFMEAPYRSHTLLREGLEILHEETQLTVAWDIDCPGETVITARVASWKRQALPSIEKKPAIFLIAK